MSVELYDQRSAIDFCHQMGEVLTIEKEIDPIYEIAALTKAFDGGPVLIFNKIKGYPHWRAVTNLLSRKERIAKMFDTIPEYLPKRILQAVNSPLPPEVIATAPCQENVVVDNIDISSLLPIIKNTKIDLGPVISGGIVMIKYPEELSPGKMSFNLSFHRMYAGLAKDWATLTTLYSRHFLEVLYCHKARKEEFPLTVNIGVSPALNVLASGGALPIIRSVGNDDLGVAGNLQETPVRICKAKTVDAYGLADAELVLEGKVMYEEKVREDQPPEGQTSSSPKQPGGAFFFPEFIGYEGFADRAFKFKVTAITYRNNPYYYTPLADSLESSHLGSLITAASIYHACKNAAPNNFLNCNILDSMRGILGAVIQCKVNHVMEQGTSQRLINAAFSAVKDLKLVVAVDEDVDIFDHTDVMWAVAIRTRPDEDINLIKGAGANPLFATRWSIDTTVPVQEKNRALRPRFNEVDLGKWLSQEKIAHGLSLMNEGARSVAKRLI